MVIIVVIVLSCYSSRIHDNRHPHICTDISSDTELAKDVHRYPDVEGVQPSYVPICSAIAFSSPGVNSCLSLNAVA